MTIIQQCQNCEKEGNKNIYCTNCIKSAENSDIYTYENEYDRFSRGNMIGRIKAYTWHDAIEYTKSNFFHNQSKNFNINCEKDFAYVEEKNTESTAMENNGKENLLGYKLYLNKEGEKSESSSIKDENLWDLTVATATSNNFVAVLNAFNKEHQQ